MPKNETDLDAANQKILRLTKLLVVATICLEKVISYGKMKGMNKKKMEHFEAAVVSFNKEVEDAGGSSY